MSIHTTKYGAVKGMIKNISSSSYNSERLGGVHLAKSVEVKIRKQSVMRYFLDPIVKGFGKSMKEK